MQAAAMTLALAAACSFAQDAQTKDKEQKEATPKTPQVSVNVGYYDWGLEGNLHKFTQYATPAKGFAIRDLYWNPGMAGGSAFFHLGTPGQRDYVVDGKFVLFDGKLTFDGSGQRNEFFDRSPMVLPRSERRFEEMSLRYALTDSVAITGRYTKDKREQFFEPTIDTRNDQNYFANGTIEGSFGGGFGSLGYSERRYFDRLDFRPDTKVKQWQGSYERELVPNLSFDASYAKSTILQQGQDDASVKSFHIGGSYALGDDTQIGYHYSNEQIDLPQVQNAWVRERFNSAATLYHRFGKWRFNGSYGRKESERVRADQSFVDLSRWDVYEGKLTGPVSDKLRLSVKAKQEALRKGAIMLTADPRSLYFVDRTTAQVKLDGGGERCNGYLVYTYGYLKNEGRDVKIRTGTLTGGTTYQLGEGLEAFGELSFERTTAKSEIASPFELGVFFPKSKTLVLGLNWAAQEGTFFSASLTEFVSDNDNPLNLPDGNVHGRSFSASVRHKTAAGNEFTLTVIPWRYDDKMLYQNGYRATVFQLTASAKY